VDPFLLGVDERCLILQPRTAVVLSLGHMVQGAPPLLEAG
jgi:hypothetical protein